MGRTDRHPGSLIRRGNAPASGNDPIHQKVSTVIGHPRLLMQVDPGAPVRVGWLRNPSLTSRARMNNLHSFDS